MKIDGGKKGMSLQKSNGWTNDAGKTEGNNLAKELKGVLKQQMKEGNNLAK